MGKHLSRVKCSWCGTAMLAKNFRERVTIRELFTSRKAIFCNTLCSGKFLEANEKEKLWVEKKTTGSL